MTSKSADLLIMDLEANILESLESYHKTFQDYVNIYPLLNIVSENTQAIQSYFDGFNKLQDGLSNLLEAFKVLCSIKNVQIKTQ